jgi:hypothetical protein
LLAAALPLAEHPRFSVPQPVDLVLHSATHLFHEGDWQHGLRDLVDLDAMLRGFAVAPAFYPSLLARAAELNLGRPLFYGLRYGRNLLQTPVPDSVMLQCPSRPSRLAAQAMDRLFLPALSTVHESCHATGAAAAQAALYVRSHWLRMPMRLLLPHLAYKFWQEQVSDRFKDEAPGTIDAR